MRFQLVQDVAIFAVSVDGPDVHVDVYGGPDNVCASVTFSFPDPVVRAENVGRLHRWERDTSALSLVVNGDTVRLLCERSLLARGLEAAAGSM